MVNSETPAVDIVNSSIPNFDKHHDPEQYEP